MKIPLYSTHTVSLTVHAGVSREARGTHTVASSRVTVRVTKAPAVLPAILPIPVARTCCKDM